MISLNVSVSCCISSKNFFTHVTLIFVFAMNICHVKTFCTRLSKNAVADTGGKKAQSQQDQISLNRSAKLKGQSMARFQKIPNKV